RHDERRLLVVLNFTGQAAQVEAGRGRVLISTGARRRGEEISATLSIAPDEGLVAERVA
ncbi:MAG: hypothetical protein JO163_00075, partial [Methylobacteriaceae bacterium]|nr:hypothetical protein [Methylobacteriaceae bacterium]